MALTIPLGEICEKRLQLPSRVTTTRIPEFAPTQNSRHTAYCGDRTCKQLTMVTFGGCSLHIYHRLPGGMVSTIHQSEGANRRQSLETTALYEAVVKKGTRAGQAIFSGQLTTLPPTLAFSRWHSSFSPGLTSEINDTELSPFQISHLYIIDCPCYQHSQTPGMHMCYPSELPAGEDWEELGLRGKQQV